MTVKQNIIAIAYNRKGHILSIGRCRYDKTHTIQARLAKKAQLPEKIFLHAEIDALIRARDKVYKLHVIRRKRNGEYGIAKPCPICQLALKEYGVKVITHT